MSSVTSRYQLKKLTEALQKIQRECDPGGSKISYERDDGQKMDGFEVAKRDLTLILLDLKKRVEQRNALLDSHGRHPETIRLKSENEKNLSRAKEKFAEMRRQLKALENRRGRKKLPDDVLQNRQQLMQHLETEILEVEAAHNGRQQQQQQKKSARTGVAKELMEKRQKEREDDRQRRIGRGEDPNDAESVEMAPMTQQTQEFMQEKNNFDSRFDDQIDQIHDGVRDLHELAIGINEELAVQEGIINEIDKKVDDLQDKFKATNKRMKLLLESTGGATRWCSLILALVILVGLIGYIFNLV